MKLLFLTFSFLTFSLFTKAQSNTIVIGTIDTINSKILNEKRTIWVYKPDNEKGFNDNQKKYPVIYLLDGDWHFVSVVGMIQQLSYINGNTICPEMIVVGITIEDRYRDLTPSCDSAISKTSGGYENFISYIKNELIPFIESNYPVAPYKVLIGHSLGGLMTINTLIKYPDLFNAYVAIDPSMWWDNQTALIESKDALFLNKYENIRLFLAIANTMDSDMDTTTVKNDRSRNTLHIRSIFELTDQLKTNTDNELNYQIKFYNNENHGSIPLIATYDALHYVFNFYNLPLTKKDYADTTMALAYRIENHYKNISDKMGYTINPSESFINTLGYSALYLNNIPLSEYFFKLNVSNYPNSFNAYDSLGDYYLAVDNIEQATNMYLKALSINDNMETRNKLKSIQKE